MKSGEPILAWIITGVLIATTADATMANLRNPYQKIVERNLFYLRPAPVITQPPSAIKQDPPKIILTGIITVLGDKRALMDVQTPAKQAEPARKRSFIIAEKQREGDIEVLEIDERASAVKLKAFGTVMTLTMQ